MNVVRKVFVFDAVDIAVESAFWAGMLDGLVIGDDQFHCVVDSSGEWHVGVQYAPNHVPPVWPDGEAQQVHLDLHVEDPTKAHDKAMKFGATLLQPGELGAREGHQVYADPAGHPFCIGWGHPSREAIAQFVAERVKQ